MTRVRSVTVSFVEEYTSNLTGHTYRWYQDASGNRVRVRANGSFGRPKTRAECRAEAARLLARRSP